MFLTLVYNSIIRTLYFAYGAMFSLLHTKHYAVIFTLLFYKMSLGSYPFLTLEFTSRENSEKADFYKPDKS